MKVLKLLKALKATNMILHEILEEPDSKCSDAQKIEYPPSFCCEALAPSFSLYVFSANPILNALQ